MSNKGKYYRRCFFNEFIQTFSVNLLFKHYASPHILATRTSKILTTAPTYYNSLTFTDITEVNINVREAFGDPIIFSPILF